MGEWAIEREGESARRFLELCNPRRNPTEEGGICDRWRELEELTG